MANGSYSAAAAVVPSDTAAQRFLGIYVGGAGNVAVEPRDSIGTTFVFTAVPVGTILPVATARVLATGTTATLLIGLT